MLFAINQSAQADDGTVADDEWRTLLSHAQADRVRLAKKLRAGMSTKALQAMENARRINLRLLTDTGLVSGQDWQRAVSAGKTDERLAQIMVRYIRIQTAAKDIWGEEKALNWLVRPNRALDGETPISLLDSDPGALAVETLLGQIEHGLVS